MSTTLKMHPGTYRAFRTYVYDAQRAGLPLYYEGTPEGYPVELPLYYEGTPEGYLVDLVELGLVTTRTSSVDGYSYTWIYFTEEGKKTAKEMFPPKAYER